MTVSKALHDNGIKSDNTPTTDSGRINKERFRDVINAVRAAEADMMEQLLGAEQHCRQAQDEARVLREENQELKQQIAQMKLKQTLESNEQITSAQREEILAITG